MSPTYNSLPSSIYSFGKEDEISRDMQVCLEGQACSQGLSVQLFEAKPGDPAVPQGKAFATISAQDAGISMHPAAAGEGCQSSLLLLYEKNTPATLPGLPPH